MSFCIFDGTEIAHPHHLLLCFLPQRLCVHHEADPTVLCDVVFCEGDAVEADEAPGGGERDDGLVEEGGESGVRNQLLGIVVVATVAQGHCGVADPVAGGVGTSTVTKLFSMRKPLSTDNGLPTINQ